MRLAEVHELIDTVASVDPACRDRTVLSAAVAASARLRAWLDGRDVTLAGQLEQTVSYPEKLLADAARQGYHIVATEPATESTPFKPQ